MQDTSTPETHARSVFLQSTAKPRAMGSMRTVMGWIGAAASCFLFVSPATTFWGIRSTGSVEQHSAAPYVATFMNCLVWLMYGLPIVAPDNTSVLAINAVGAGIELFYVAIFLYYSAGLVRATAGTLLGGAVFLVSVGAALVLTLAHTHEERATVIGWVGMFTGAGMYVSPVFTIIEVIQTESVEYLPLPVCIASLLNAISWTLYASNPLDLFIAVPNVAGMVFGFAQLGIYLYYYHKNTQKNVEA